MDDVGPLRRGIVCAFAVGGLLASGCNLPISTEAPAPPITDAPLPAPTEVGCAAGDLSAPEIAAGASLISESLTPSFAWFYEGECAPDGFRLEVAPGGEFDSPEAMVGAAAEGDTSWTPSQPLQPATAYRWRVAGVLGGDIGPFSIASEFWTGPTCDGSALVAPTLLLPAQDALLDDASPALAWDYPSAACLQAAYNFEVTDDPTFSRAVLEGSAGPSPSFETTLPYLQDCIPYLWRVRAVYGEDMSGPYSEVGLFTTDLTGACPTRLWLPRVSGIVWADECDAAGVIPGQAPAPPGCVYREGGYGGDGARQPGEPGIAGVTVRYAAGPCPASGEGRPVWEPTGSDGAYLQILTPGTYCFWIDPVADGNDAALGRGLSTYPPGGYDFPSNHEITLDWGDAMDGFDFGWDPR
jgi:hypothetical protein